MQSSHGAQITMFGGIPGCAEASCTSSADPAPPAPTRAHLQMRPQLRALPLFALFSSLTCGVSSAYARSSPNLLRASHLRAQSALQSRVAVTPSASLLLRGGTLQAAQPLIRMVESPAARTVAVIVGVVVHIAYHASLIRREKLGLPTWRTAQARTRLRWASLACSTTDPHYAMECLHNAIIASTFLASTMVTLFTFTLGFLAQKVWGNGASRLVVPMSAFSALVVCSAYHFLQSARLCTHAGFMFPVASSTAEPDAFVTPATVERIMARSEGGQWGGLRFLYLAANSAVWVVAGEHAFLASCLAFVLFFSRIDKAPTQQQQEQESRRWRPLVRGGASSNGRDRSRSIAR